MKKLLLPLCATILAGCNNKDFDAVNSADEQRYNLCELTLEITEAAISRVNITESGDSWIVSWDMSDMIGAWSTQPDINDQSCFTISEIYDDQSATFSGLIPSECQQIRFLHPYDATLSKGDDNTIELNLDEQCVGQDFSHLSAKSYMVSQLFEVDPEQETLLGEAISISHLDATIELKMKFEDEQSHSESDFTITKVVLGDENFPLPLKAKLNIEDATLATQESGALTLEAENIEAVDEIYYIRFNTFPFTAGTNTSLPIEVSLLDKEGNAYSCEAVVAAGGDIERATKNTFYARLSNPVKVDNVWSVLSTDLSAEYEDNNGTNILNGVAFSLNQVRLSNNSIQFQADQGCIYNISPLPSISKIVITQGVTSDGVAQSCNTLTICTGNEQNPLATLTAQIETVIIDGVELRTYSYYPDTESSYFTISNSSSAAYCSSIEVYYSGELTPFIFAESSSMTFNAEGETISTQITTLNNLNDEQVSLWSSNDQFSASLSGNTLCVTAQENCEDQAQEGTISISIEGGNSFEITLSQPCMESVTGAGCSIDWTALYDSTTTLGDGFSLTYGDYKITFTDGSTSTKWQSVSSGSTLRLYGGGTMTIENTNGESISSIEIKCSASDYANFSSANCGVLSTNSNIVTWSGIAESVTLWASDKCYMQYVYINGGGE